MKLGSAVEAVFSASPLLPSFRLRSETCRQHMLQELLHLAERCDGMRVDMAMLCVNDVVERTTARFMVYHGGSVVKSSKHDITMPWRIVEGHGALCCENKGFSDLMRNFGLLVQWSPESNIKTSVNP